MSPCAVCHGGYGWRQRAALTGRATACFQSMYVARYVARLPAGIARCPRTPTTRSRDTGRPPRRGTVTACRQRHGHEPPRIMHRHHHHHHHFRLFQADMRSLIYIQTHNIHPFNGPFSGTTRVSRCQKGKTSLDFTEARDSEWQWHPLGHMQVCTSLQTDNHAMVGGVA